MRTRRPRRAAALVALALAIAWIAAGPARPAAAACDCTRSTVPVALAESTVVFTGALRQVEPTGELTVLRFTVDDVFKGEPTTDFGVATFSDPEQCGLGSAVPLGDWLVFAVQFPPESGSFYVSACGPSALLDPAVPLPAELGVPGRPIDAVPETTVAPPRSVVAPIVPTTTADDRGWRRPVLTALGGLAVIGLCARILAGRRCLVA